MKTKKQLEKEFKELHLKCIEETNRLGRAEYRTHGKRCEALGSLTQTNEIIELIEERIDYWKQRSAFSMIEELQELLTKIKGDEK